MSDEIFLLSIDNYNLRLIVEFEEKLKDPNLSAEAREMYEILVKGCKENLTMDYESVEDPFLPGHSTVVKFKRGTQRPLTYEEKRFNALSPEEQEKVRQHTKSKRKIFSSSKPPVELTSEDCDRLAEESDRYRKEISAKLDRLDHISAEDLKTRVK